MAWQRVQLPDTQIGEPGPLPHEIEGLPAEVLANLGAHLDPTGLEELGLTGIGFVWVDDPPPPPVVPDEVPMYKVRKFLIKEGMLQAVESALAAMEGQAGDLARVDWEYAPNLVRTSPLVQGIGATLGLTSEEINALVIAANALP